MSQEEDEQDRQWEMLYQAVRACVRDFGTEGIRSTNDVWIDDDNIGTRQQKIYVHNLMMVQPHIVKALQSLLTTYPGWEIMVAIAVSGPGESWPEMGLTIRSHEIIDGLQRQYFPPEYRGIHYEGSRPGTDRD